MKISEKLRQISAVALSSVVLLTCQTGCAADKSANSDKDHKAGHSAESNPSTAPSTSPDLAKGLPIDVFETVLKKVGFEVPADAYVKSASGADIQFSNAKRMCKHKDTGTLLDYTIVESSGRISMKYYTVEAKPTPEAARLLRSIAENIAPELARKFDDVQKEYSKTHKASKGSLGEMTIYVEPDCIRLRCDLPQKEKDNGAQ